MYTIQTTPEFLRTARKFFISHPELKNRFKTIVEILATNPNDKSLKLHTLRGKLQGLCTIRLTYKYRITLLIRITQKEIVLLDIGSHDVVY